MLYETYTFFETYKIPFVDVWYKELINNTEVELNKIIDFLEIDANWQDIASAVNPSLYRNRN